jgi:hypothetical protein
MRLAGDGARGLVLIKAGGFGGNGFIPPNLFFPT